MNCFVTDYEFKVNNSLPNKLTYINLIHKVEILFFFKDKELKDCAISLPLIFINCNNIKDCIYRFYIPSYIKDNNILEYVMQKNIGVPYNKRSKRVIKLTMNGILELLTAIS